MMLSSPIQYPLNILLCYMTTIFLIANVKLGKIAIFSEKGQNGNLLLETSEKSWNFSRSRVTK